MSLSAVAGTVAEGFQVKYAPEDGGPPVKFETLSDLDIDSEDTVHLEAEFLWDAFDGLNFR